MARIIPKFDHRSAHVVLVAHGTQGCGAKFQIPSGCRFEREPAGCEHPQKMATGKKQNVSLNGPHAAQSAVCSLTHLTRCFTAGASIAEQLPVRTLSMYFFCAAALILAVIPFDQVAIDLG